MTQTFTWWAVLAMLAVATATDLRARRVPNWLVVPFLLGGVLFSSWHGGIGGLITSLRGVGLAVIVTGALCYLRGLGMGDLKLFAAIGSWVGPDQLATALVVTAIVGGLMAVIWATASGTLQKSLDGAGDLIDGLFRKGFKPHRDLQLGNPAAQKIPYVPAIALGTIFSFFTLPA
jgi:prepilin peptidase CpaA